MNLKSGNTGPNRPPAILCRSAGMLSEKWSNSAKRDWARQTRRRSCCAPKSLPETVCVDIMNNLCWLACVRFPFLSRINIRHQTGDYTSRLDTAFEVVTCAGSCSEGTRGAEVRCSNVMDTDVCRSSTSMYVGAYRNRVL